MRQLWRHVLGVAAVAIAGTTLPRAASAQVSAKGPPSADPLRVVGCYAGSGIRVPGRYRPDSLHPPVLRLDSARARGSAPRRSAAILLRDQSREASWAWRGDSIAVWITVSIPQRYFVLAAEPDSLRGRGSDAADVVYVDAEGREHAPEQRWPVRLARVDCPAPVRPDPP